MTEFHNTDPAAFRGVWVFCEQRGGELNPTCFELLSEGRKLADDLGVELCGLLLGDGVAALAPTLGGYGADRVYVCQHPLLKDYTTDAYTKVVCGMVMERKPEIVLIGATTENPSFEINSALLSRCKVFVLEALTPAQVTAVLRRALADERGFGGQGVQIDGECLSMIAAFANGDARTALGTLEMAVLNGRRENGHIYVEKQLLEQCVSKKSLLYDKAGEEHYNLISALHKSMRNSDPDAAVYWLARMLEAGEDPLYVARRLIRFASEDIGLADSRALEIAVAAYQACHFLGMPECNLHLAHAVIYLSLAPRSNAVYRAYEAAKQDALHMLDEPVPLVIRNAPTRLMGELGYGEGYVYAHDTADKIAAMECLPESLRGRRYYVPGEAGSEARAKQRLEAVLRWRAEHAQGAKPQPQSEEQSGRGGGAEPGTQAQPQGEEQNRHGGGAPGAKQAAR